MWNPDPLELAEWQLERDRVATARFAGLFERKIARISVSPVAYLRGSAPLFYRLLEEHPELREGPADAGWICGDSHLENFGVFRVEADKHDALKSAQVVFDVNDFDEAVVAPFRYDVLRLCTSLILSARQLGESGGSAIALCTTLVGAYTESAASGSLRVLPEPAPVTVLVNKASRRSHKDLLEARTTGSGAQRRFVRGPRYADLQEPWLSAARPAFDEYVRALPEATNHPERFEVQDVAFRIAGTGSLGALRIAVLTRGKSDDESSWLFDMKEQGTPSAALVASEALRAATNPAERVATAIRACLAQPPRMMGTTTLNGVPLFVRRLAPQEDKLLFANVEQKDLEPVARYLGALLGRMHRRGSDTPPAPWTAAEANAVVDHAVVLAGIHEATYLAVCKSVARGALVERK